MIGSPLRTNVNGYRPPPLPLIADLRHIVVDPFNGPTEPGLTLCFLDGSRAIFRGIKTEDWDYENGVVTVIKGKVEHVFPLAQVAYINWLAP